MGSFDVVDALAEGIDKAAADNSFAGVIRVDSGEEVLLARAYGYADRAHRVANTVETQFGIASGVKGLTGLTVVSLVEEGILELGTTARALLGSDLPLIADSVTVEHLLRHRSGIGDYLDEDAVQEITDYVMPVPIHELASTEQYLVALDGNAAAFEPDARFSYNNAGYVLLAVIAERVTGIPFHDLVAQRVCRPAGLIDTAFLRSDELPGRAAIGYLAADGLRSNVLHLPVCGSGDGGIYSTAADIHALWNAFFTGRIVSRDWVTEMVRPRNDALSETKRYGLGFWLHPSSDAVMLEGYDAGVSFRTVHDPGRRITYTVLSNWSGGAWPMTRSLDELLAL